MDVVYRNLNSLFASAQEMKQINLIVKGLIKLNFEFKLATRSFQILCKMYF